MKKEIDARGLNCPEPVLLTRKALEDHDEVVVTVNDRTAEENIKRMAQGMGCMVTVERRGADVSLHIGSPARSTDEETCTCTEAPAGAGPVVVVFASDVMGRGNDELGAVLMRAFIHTLAEGASRPDTMIFMNTGVKLAVEGSEVLPDLKALAGKGAKILACGTCLGFFELKDRLGVGVVSNMYDIAEAMLGAGKLVQV
ncbi:MAG TPA: sulfurtransferase-like selenium metabolism protein YedF [Deltaproteobacteria bacterium]|jgi:selenium metabolism protein YedF|nr:sulfurtransferase-like selenium metabolism protein YedF [Deltaproteobacteria bacterium]HOI06908.1 sulfurtransferase-like selenium metabolism protein YedF [Deltaproteobacteria bacterium]